MSGDSLHTEKELLRQVAAGNEDAFTRLFHRYRKKVATVAFTLTRSETRAEELVQDVFLKLWLQREKLVEVEKPESWLFIITRNEAYRMLKEMATHRSRQNKVGEKMEEVEAYTPDGLIEKEYDAVLKQAIEQLSPQQQEIYRLIKEEGLTRQQTADQLKIHPFTVKTHLAHAMRRIRAYCMARLEFFILMVLFGRHHL